MISKAPAASSLPRSKVVKLAVNLPDAASKWYIELGEVASGSVRQENVRRVIYIGGGALVLAYQGSGSERKR
jgi:hypothetical protein